MVFDGLTGHRATRYTNGPGEDRFGQAIENWSVAATGIPCRLVGAFGMERTTDESVDVQTVTHKLFVRPNHGLVEADRVSIVDADGITLVDMADVVEVRRISGRGSRQHHHEIMLRKVRGS